MTDCPAAHRESRGDDEEVTWWVRSCARSVHVDQRLPLRRPTTRGQHLVWDELRAPCGTTPAPASSASGEMNENTSRATIRV